ncbi:MAG: shikimate dehydrogenase [Candidatus Lokiarchaeota archaeon]|nr:shikimate dehydrogenase [Candidatus Lokiarchaeota archaeon]
MLNNPYINTRTKVLCVIGHPIEHSMSPSMHNAALKELSLDFVYLAFDVSPKDLEKAVLGFKKHDMKGINVTIPHKEAIIKYLDKIDPLAEKIGAVNTIKNINGQLIGRNTDAFGAKKALIDTGFELRSKKALIIGAGGAARAISFALSDEIDEIFICNRNEKRAIRLAKDLKDSTKTTATGRTLSNEVLKSLIDKVDLLINTTPLGMYPDVEKTPIPQKLLANHLFVYDIIYNPLKTQLLKDACEIGCKTLNGIDMFINQGALAFEWWTDMKPNINTMKEKILELLAKK